MAAGDHSFWLGVYELEKMRAFASRIVEGSVVYDVGAHAGSYTLAAARRVGESGRVVAFEPDPQNLGYLARHVSINHMENVTVIPAAVADRNGRAQFVKSPTSIEGKRTSDPQKQGYLGTGNLEVAVVSLDHLHATGQIPLPKVIKIDIEGGEYDALIGARELLGSGPTIFLATHGPAVHDRCCRLLEQLDYVLTPLDADNLGEAKEILAEPGTGPGGPHR